MADGPTVTPAFPARKAPAWTELFRCFQVALDPRKLLLAAVGILAMSLGWYLLSVIFYHSAPRREDPAYSTQAMRNSEGDKKPDGTDYTEAEYNAAAERRFREDLTEWKVLHDVAGPGGQLRTLPWSEYRGPNPFDTITTLLGGTSVDIGSAVREFFTGTIPVLVEPLRKTLLPVLVLLDPHASFLTRVYLLLSLGWGIAVWAFFGGVITRIAAVQFSGKDRVTLRQAVQFVCNRYVSYLLSPLVPLGVIAFIVVCMAIYGLLAMIPGLGDLVLYGLGFPLVVVGGIAIAVLLIGMIGYPLMYTTISAEGTDTFDAVSRAYNYVFQAPWNYLGYAIVAVLYGALVTLFVVFMGSLMVYMGKWAVSQAPFSETWGRNPDFLFEHAPESFGWRELLLRGSPLEQQPTVQPDELTGRTRVTYTDADPVAAKQYRDNVWGVERLAGWMVTFWLALVFLLVIGFSYSYFWSASTMLYLLMRKKVDETELDEVYIEDASLEAPIGATPPATTTPPATGGAVSLPTVPPAASPVSPPPAVVPPAPTASSTADAPKAPTDTGPAPGSTPKSDNTAP